MNIGSNYVGITGIGLPKNAHSQTKSIPFASGVPFRNEISSLFYSEDPHSKRQWTLFILALDIFKRLPVDDRTSYFQIAGIHGYPMTAWNGVDEPAKDPENVETLHPGKDQYGGYCTHNSIAFPTWHRVYLLLFEQCVWHHMKDVISSWNLEDHEAAQWYEAAHTWRLPYWDWGRDSCLPEAVTLDHVRIFPPGSQASNYINPYPNPLKGFQNPEKDEHDQPLPFGSMPVGKRKWNITDNQNNEPRLPWSKCSGTSRYGLDIAPDSTTYVGTEGRNNVTTANTFMAECSQHWYSPYKEQEGDKEWQPPSGLSDAIHSMFTTASSATWGTFASTKWWQESERQGPGFMSLEYIHNNVHNLCGGNKFSRDGGQGIGHMADVPVAAFDPIFWLHHCNIDRLTAMWQCLNWELWWDKPEPEHAQLKGGNFPDPRSTDPLLPFRTAEDPNTFWTSDDVRDWTRLNYQYEDLEPSNHAILPNGELDENQYQQDLRDHINLTYGNTEGWIRGLEDSTDVNSTDILHLATDQGRCWDDYILDVVYDRYALRGSSYSIEFSFQDDYSERLVGEVYSLGGLPVATPNNTQRSCANCTAQKSSSVLSRVQVPLTGHIIAQFLRPNASRPNSLEPHDIATYLRDHLRWKFVRLGGQPAPAYCLPKTDVRLWAGRRSLYDSDRDRAWRAEDSTRWRAIDLRRPGLNDAAVRFSLRQEVAIDRVTEGRERIRARL